MDIFLEENCPHLIESIKHSGNSFEDVIQDPLYCIFGWNAKGPENYSKQYGKEIDAVLEFADEYDVDISEFDLSTIEKKVSFALMYIATELQSDYSSFICIKDDWYNCNGFQW